jgi:hypothetical protein
MRPSPGLVLAALLVLIATQVTRLLLPGRGPYPWTLLLSAAGLIGGEMVAGSGYLASPALGVLHPLADAVVIAVLQAGGAYVAAPPAPAGGRGSR